MVQQLTESSPSKITILMVLLFPSVAFPLTCNWIKYSSSIYVIEDLQKVVWYVCMYVRTSSVSLLKRVKFILSTDSSTNINIPDGLENGTTLPIWHIAYTKFNTYE